MGARWIWAEIEAIYPGHDNKPSRYDSKPCLSIQLRDIQRFRSGLNPLTRFLITKKMQSTGTPINLQQKILELPIEEIVSQIKERFSNELQRYNIQIQSYRDFSLENVDARHEIIIPQNRKSIVFAQIICASFPFFLFFVFGIFLLEKAHCTGYTIYNDTLEFMIVIGATFLVFGTLCLFLAFRIVKPRLMLTINAQGITQGKFHETSKFFVPWSEIESISISYYQSQKLLTIRLKNLGQYLAQYSQANGFVSRFNVKAFGAPIGVFQSSLEMPLEDLLRELSATYTDELRRYNIRLRSLI